MIARRHLRRCRYYAAPAGVSRFCRAANVSVRTKLAIGDYSLYCFFFSSRRRHTRSDRDWSSDVCSSDLEGMASPTVSLAPPSGAPYLRPVNLNLLRQAAIFQDLDDGELARVSEVCREQKFAVGQQVFKEGEPGNRLFIISEGEVRISRTIPGSGEEALAVLKPGACFGEMAIFDRSERSTDAIANTSCTLLTIARSDFELLLDFNRDIAYKVLWSVVRLLSARLRVTNDNLRSFLAMSMF